MSKDDRDVLTVGDQTHVEPTPVEEDRATKKARLAKVLDRGLSADRLSVPLPSHLHGEWVPNDQTAIYEKEALGFQIDSEYAPKRALHSKGGQNMSIVGDCIFMVCSKENKELIDEIRHEQYLKLNRKGKVQKEEKDFNTQASNIGLEPISEGSINEARKAELEEVLKTQAAQTIK